MTEYVSEKTGAVVFTDSELGGVWVPVEESDSSKFTVKELESLLTELGVEIPKGAKKPELLALYQKNKA